MNRRTNNLATRRGFAVIMALSLVILVGAALATAATYFTLEATRTRAATEDAQLRQLLTTGALAAIARAETPGAAKAVALPAELSGAGLTLTITGEGDDRSAEVRATFSQRMVEQTLKLHRTDRGWTVVAVQ